MSLNQQERKAKANRGNRGWLVALLLVACAAGCGRERGTVAPTLSAIAPARAIQGQTLQVTLTGANFETGATVNVGSAPITVSGAVVASSSQIAAQFAIPAGATPGSQSISVTSGGVTTNAVAFYIAAPLAVTATTPARGAVGVLINQAVNATFSEPLNCATVNAGSFTLAAVGGAAVTGAVACSGSTATFTPAANLASNQPYSATLSTAITDTSGDPMSANYNWTFTTLAAPTVIATTPANGATGVPPALPAISATFSQAMNCATITPASFTLTSPTGPVAGAVTCLGGSATFTPGAALATNAIYSANIAGSAASATGATLAGPYKWNFTTAPVPPTAPTVISTNPANGATATPLTQAIAATFNEAMDPATLTASTFTLAATGTAGAPGPAVTGIVTYVAAGSTATFTPGAPLAALTQYTATITTGAESLADTAMAANYVWSFTTGTAPDTTKPTVLSTLPANLATAVPINQAISAIFSKSMNPATIDGATFTLTMPGTTSGTTTPVAGLVTYAAIAETATFTPTANLLPATTYTATITTGAQDLSGNPLGAGAAPNPWTFTTAAAVDTTHPTILSTNPADAATGVATNATVNATFSEAMNPLTITTSTFQLATSGGTAVGGTVAYNATSMIATFTPTADLAAGDTYNATIGSSVADLAGNTLVAGAAANPWSFTVAAVVQPVVNLGTASAFGGFGGGAGMTNSGLNTVINGNIGTTGASTLMTGFNDQGPGCVYTETPLNVGNVNGTIDTAPPPPTVACPTEGTAATMAIATQAAADALTAFNATSPALMPPTVAAQAAELGGLTLAPGVYQSASGSYSIANGNLTLDAQGNANAVFVFQAATSLTVGIAGPAGARSVILINGAQAQNVYWHVGSAATINGAGGGTMVGTILSQSGITFSTAGNVALTTLNGRALALTGPVTMVNTVINVPLP